MQSVYYFIMVPMVYFAFAVFLVGIIVHIVKIWLEPKHSTTLQIYPEKKPKWLWALHDTFLFPTIRRHKPVLWVFMMAFHICLLLLLIGHLELIADFAIFQIIPHEIFLGNGFVGLILEPELQQLRESNRLLKQRTRMGHGIHHLGDKLGCKEVNRITTSL